ncbi:SAM-dependent methyltransferase [Bosea sp. PAMC 26642]|nr:SAM-dependent methyltransferase [Bosea sp. PAMC 26642]
MRHVLHVGCGGKAIRRLHQTFRDANQWHEIRLDVDEKVEPDIICSTVDMRGAVPTASVDAVWSSHNVEHLYDHEVPLAFAEFLRVLRPDGYFLMRCPDLEAVAEAMLKDGLENVAYVSPAGPITPLDMLFGHRASVARGNEYMAHKTGFTDLRLGRLLLEAGFGAAYTKRMPGFDLWAVAFAPQADVEAGIATLAGNGLNFQE